MSEPRYGPTTLVTGRAARLGGSRVPAVVALFWVTKALTTAFGESTSDWLVHALSPVVAVLLGFVGFCVALGLQLRASTYSAPRYWFAVAMVGVFGTMAADVVHVGLGVPYLVSTIFFALVLAGCFTAWQRSEGTLSVHAITTRRRELYYWSAVVSTFAFGTAIGDLTATAGLGYFASALLFAALIAVPAIGRARYGLHPVAAFWTAYVLTRPVGASVADWLGRSHADGGVGVGTGTVSLLLGLALVASVAHLHRTGADAPEPS
ncbi:MAG TPA: hypothetical protein VMB79_07010 [Jatrophihabitans sp.]|nr:hypothetical protein [Jatrophihabitans sp.]